MQFILYLCMLITPQPVCHTQTFEDHSAIRECVEYREGTPALCTYLYDEFSDLIYWECNSKG